MLVKSLRALCLALSVQSLASVVSSRAISVRDGCTGQDCETSSTPFYSASNAIGNAPQGPEPALTPWKKAPVDAIDGSVRPRAVVPLPKPRPINEPEPEPVAPGDKPNVIPGLGKATPDEELDDATRAKFCSGNSVTLRSRSTCHPGTSGDDSGTRDNFGENPAVDTSPPTDVQPAEQVTDFFELVRGGNAGPNRARDAFLSRDADSTPDEPIPDIDAFDKHYKFGTLDRKQIDATEGRQDARRLLQEAGFEYEQQGVSISAVSRAAEDQDLGFPFHESTWSNDGRVMMADYSFRSLDHTPAADRLPWFKVVMHIRAHRLPDAAPVKPGSDLAIGRVHIINESTIKTIDSIFKSLNPSGDADTLVLRSDAAAGSDEAMAFDAFSRTDNAAGIFWLLANYRQALGGKIVREVRIIKGSATTSETPAAVFIIGDKVI